MNYQKAPDGNHLQYCEVRVLCYVEWKTWLDLS